MDARIQSKLKQLSKKLKAIKAKDIMTKKVITARPNKTLADIAEIMIKHRISGLPVVDAKQRLVGMITTTDLFLVMDMIESGSVVEEDMREVSNPAVKFAMTAVIKTLKKTTSLDDIIATMKYHNIHTLPVLEKKKIVGVIGRRDVFKAFYNAVKELD